MQKTLVTPAAELVEKALAKLAIIDFSMLKSKLQDREEGLGWTADQCAIAEQDYQRFLALKFAYPAKKLCPIKL